MKRLLNTGVIVMKCPMKENKNFKSHNISYCLIEVIAKAGLTIS